MYLYQKPHEDMQDLVAMESLEASALFQQFEADEMAAGTKYINQVVSVAGQVAEMSQLDSGNVVVFLRGEMDMFGLSCAFDAAAAEKLSSVQAGDAIRIKGIVSGMNMDVNLIRCVIEE